MLLMCKILLYILKTVVKSFVMDMVTPSILIYGRPLHIEMNEIGKMGFKINVDNNKTLPQKILV